MIKIKHLVYPICFALCCMFSIHLVGQKNNHLKDWDEGPLQWSDFKYKAFECPVPSAIYYQLLIDEAGKKEDGIKVYSLKVRAAFDKDLSYTDKTPKSDTLLMHYQNIFDIVELVSRDLQYYVDYEAKISEVRFGRSYLISEYYQRIEAEINQYIKDTDNGKLHNNVESYHKLLKDDLLAMPKNSKRKYRDRIFGMDMDFGSAFIKYPSKMAVYMPDKFGVKFGMDIHLKKIVLGLNANFYNFKLKKDLELGAQFWSKEYKLAYNSIYFNGGYQVYDRKKIRITPYVLVGSNMLNYYTGSGNNRVNVLETDEFSYGCGAYLDFKLFRYINLIPSIYNLKEKSDHGLRLMVQASKASIGTNNNGIEYLLGLSYYMSTRVIK